MANSLYLLAMIATSLAVLVGGSTLAARQVRPVRLRARRSLSYRDLVALISR